MIKLTFKIYDVAQGVMVPIVANTKDFSLSQVWETELITRTKCEGYLTFLGANYDIIKRQIVNGYFKSEFQIIEQIGDALVTGKYTIYNAIIENRGVFVDEQKMCKCKCVIVDEYTKFLDDPKTNIETEFNFLEGLEKKDVILPTRKYGFDLWQQIDNDNLQNTGANFGHITDLNMNIKGTYGTALFDVQLNMWARQIDIRNLIDGNTFERENWQILINDGSKFTAARDWVNGIKTPNVKAIYWDSDTLQGDFMLTNEDIIVVVDYFQRLTQGSNVFVYDLNYPTPTTGEKKDFVFQNNELKTFTFRGSQVAYRDDDEGLDGYFQTWFNLYTYTRDNWTIEQDKNTTRAVDFYQGLMNTIQKVDNSINFFDFSILQNNYSTLFCAKVEDLINENNGRQLAIISELQNPDLSDSEIESLNNELKTLEPATSLTISLKKIFDWLEQKFNIYWVIEYGVFKLKFVAEKVNNTLLFDLTNYKGKNWVLMKDYEYTNSNEYSILNRSYDSNNPDFKGVDINIIGVIDYNKKTIDLNGFTVDIWDLFDNDSPSKDNMAIFSCDSNTYTEFLDFVNGDNPYYFTHFDYVSTINKYSLSSIGVAAYVKSTNVFKVIKNGTGRVISNHFIYAESINLFSYRINYVDVKTNKVYKTDEVQLAYAGNNYVTQYIQFVAEKESYIYVELWGVAPSFPIDGIFKIDIQNVQIIKDTFKVEESETLLTNEIIPNNKLSLSYTDNLFVANLPEKNAEVNGEQRAYIYKKNNALQSAIQLPITDLLSKIILNQKIISNFGSGIIDKYTRKYDGSPDEIDILKNENV